MTANAKVEIEITREDAEARLYHLEVRLAELGLDRVMRQEENIPVSAADYDAAEHVFHDLHRLMGPIFRRRFGEDQVEVFGSLEAEIKNATDDAQWLMERVMDEMHKVTLVNGLSFGN